MSRPRTASRIASHSTGSATVAASRYSPPGRTALVACMDSSTHACKSPTLATLPATDDNPRGCRRAGRYAGFCTRPESRDGHLSRDCVAAALQRSTRHLGEQPHRCLSDLAPGEVYPASPIARAPGGLLHHRFTLTPAAEAAVAVCSLLHFLAGCPGWVLPTALLCGARTFLGAPGGPDATRPSGRPVCALEGTGFRGASPRAALRSPRATARTTRAGPWPRWPAGRRGRSRRAGPTRTPPGSRSAARAPRPPARPSPGA